MRAIILCFISCLLLAADKPAEELQKLQGTWLLASVEAGGTVNEKVAPTRLVIKGDNFTFYRGELVGLSGTVKIDPKASPKVIDLIRTTDNTNQMAALYTVEGDTLRLCYTEKNERPKEFKTRDIPDNRISTYRKMPAK